MRNISYVLLAGLSSLALAGAAEASDLGNSLAAKASRPEAAALQGSTAMRLGAPVPASPMAHLGNKLENTSGASLGIRETGSNMKLGAGGNANKAFGASLMASPTGQSIGAGLSNSLSSTRVSMANELSASPTGNVSNNAILGLSGSTDSRGANAALSNSLTLGK